MTAPVQHLTTATPLSMTAPVHLTTTSLSMTTPIQHLTTATTAQHLTALPMTAPVQHLTTTSSSMTTPIQHLTTATTVQHLPRTVTKPVQLQPTAAINPGFCNSMASNPNEQSNLEHMLTVCWLLLKPLPAQQQQSVIHTI